MFLSSEGGSEYWEVIRGELSQGCPLCRVSHCGREDCKVWGSRLLCLMVGWGGIVVGLSLFIIVWFESLMILLIVMPRCSLLGE